MVGGSVPATMCLIKTIVRHVAQMYWSWWVTGRGRIPLTHFNAGASAGSDPFIDAVVAAIPDESITGGVHGQRAFRSAHTLSICFLYCRAVLRLPTSRCSGQGVDGSMRWNVPVGSRLWCRRGRSFRSLLPLSSLLGALDLREDGHGGAEDEEVTLVAWLKAYGASLLGII